MNIIILAHERSLNKAEGFLIAYKNENVTIVTDSLFNKKLRPYTLFAKDIIVVKNFNLLEIIKKVNNCDKIWCVSENLLPIQSQLESYYGIDNLSPFAAEVLSNKQLFDDFCRQIGLGDYVPVSITPTFHNQLTIFENNEIFTKPDIGTGNNVFYPGSEQNAPDIEYRRWNNRHHFLKYIKDKGIHNEFFDLNKQGIYTQRFNNKVCKIMFQEYFWSTEPSISPIGYVKNGVVHVAFYVKNSKIKYGDLLDPNNTPIESHSVSKKSDIAKDLAVWIVSNNEVDQDRHRKIEYFLQTIIDKLQIKDLFFAGPDFHISNDRLIAIDFNPRPGQFINILDKINNYTILSNIINGTPIEVKTQLLWGCTMLTPGKIKSIENLDNLKSFFNAQNIDLKSGMIIPEFQNLQNKDFYFNLNITGNSEQELFDNYKKINQLLQDCISY